MDGDEVDLRKLVTLKKLYPNIMLYVDEAHAIGVRGAKGLGCAGEQGCMTDIDFLTGTFGKALASVGGYIICRKVIREYLINKMIRFSISSAQIAAVKDIRMREAPSGTVGGRTGSI